MGALAAAYTMLVLALLDRVLARRVFLARRYSPALTVFLIVALVDASGVVAVLIASPLAAAVQVFGERLIATRRRKVLAAAADGTLTQPIPLPEPARSLAAIDKRIARARQRLLLMPPEESTQLANVVARLDALAAEARRATSSR